MSAVGRIRRTALWSVLAVAAGGVPAHAATFVLDVADLAGVGFNDAAPATPIGGNTGTTVGEQRRIAFQHALDIWGKAIDGSVPIHVSASFAPLDCSEGSAVLGMAGPGGMEFEVPGQDPAVIYPEALADQLAGYDLAPGVPDIEAEFNGALPECFPDYDWYYGLDSVDWDNRANLVMVVLHEIGHGLGFQSTADDTNGEFLLPETPDPFSKNLLDVATGKHWDELTPAERVASHGSVRGLVWDGRNGNAAAARWLNLGAPRIRATPEVPGLRDVIIDANYGRPLAQGSITGTVTAPTPADACSELASLAGQIVLLPDADCHPLNQVFYAEAAGARAAILVTSRNPPPSIDQSAEALAVLTPTLTTVGLPEADALLLLAATGVTVELDADPTRRIGTDAQGRIYIYASNPVTTSSASHIDPIVRPDAVLEPSQTVNIHQDLTLEIAMLHDIGWSVPCGNGTPDAGEECDDGAANSDTTPDACRLDCTRAKCGDGVVDTGEECDASAGTPICRPTCRRPACGDGILDSGEGCDDGAANSSTAADACRLDCTPARCGDGVVDSGEGCDAPNAPATCLACVPVAVTGGTGGTGGASAPGVGGAGPASGGTSGAVDSPSGEADEEQSDSGCGCRLSGGAQRADPSALVTLGALGLWLSRRHMANGRRASSRSRRQSLLSVAAD